MSNIYSHGRTKLKVGYIQQGADYEGGNCKHLKENDEAYGYSRERDSFGSETYLMCEKCYKQHLKDYSEELVTCHDCGQEVARCGMIAWKPFDYHEPSGDKPLMICNSCSLQMKHLDRINDDYDARDMLEHPYE